MVMLLKITLFPCRSMEQPQSLSDIVKGLAAKVTSEYFLLTVRRGHIMEDTLRGVRRSKFEPTKKLTVAKRLMFQVHLIC